MAINDKSDELITEFAKTEALGWASSVAGDLDFYLEEGKMKSPIEQMFYVAWAYGTQIDNIILCPQHQIGKYYCDFYVDLLAHFSLHDYPFTETQINDLKASLPLIAIELDGHEWHEKSKDQVEKDKQRERFIVSQGYKVFRFSGREVFRRPLDCVVEVRNFIRPILKNEKQKVWGK